MSMIIEVAAILGLLFFRNVTVEAAREALMLFGRDVVPSLFPYMYFCRMLGGKTGKHRGLREPFVMILGMLGGSPSGSALLAQCASEIPDEKRYAMAAVASTISPIFLLSTLNGWIDDAVLCRLLLCSHVLGALLAGAMMRKTTPARIMIFENHGQERATVGNAMIQSMAAILNVGGCIVIYTVISSMIMQIPYISHQTGAILHAMLEIAGGMKALCAAFQPSLFRSVLFAAAAGFGGMSIVTQNHEYLAALGVRKRDLIAIGLVKAVLSGGIMAVLYLLYLSP